MCYNIIKVRISIHAPRERSDAVEILKKQGKGISIHAPRERSDRAGRYKDSTVMISIHAPRERSDVHKPKLRIYL